MTWPRRGRSFYERTHIYRLCCQHKFFPTVCFEFSFFFFFPPDWFVLLVVTCCLWERKHRASCVPLWLRAWRQTGSQFPAPPTLRHAHSHCRRNCNTPFLCLVCVRTLCDCAVTKHRPGRLFATLTATQGLSACTPKKNQKSSWNSAVVTLPLFSFSPVDYFWIRFLFVITPFSECLPLHFFLIWLYSFIVSKLSLVQKAIFLI